MSYHQTFIVHVHLLHFRDQNPNPAQRQLDLTGVPEIRKTTSFQLISLDEQPAFINNYSSEIIPPASFEFVGIQTELPNLPNCQKNPLHVSKFKFKKSISF